MTKKQNSGLIQRKKEMELIQEGLKKENTHPKETSNTKPGEDANGMTAKTLVEMKRYLKKVPHKSAATAHDKTAYDDNKKSK